MLTLATLAALALVAATTFVYGDVITWTGAGSDNLWSTPQNWDLLRTPAYNDDVVFGQGTTCVANGFTTVASIKLDGDPKRSWDPSILTVLSVLSITGSFNASVNTEVALTTAGSELVCGGKGCTLQGKFTFVAGAVTGSMYATGTTVVRGRIERYKRNRAAFAIEVTLAKVRGLPVVCSVTPGTYASCGNSQVGRAR